jgi:2-keto-4-pentenoate hydratase/2-oxohepta-3-ene-1,7-dioic acid hydratase in catechol pathway
MKLLYFRNGEHLRLGIATNKGVLDVDAFQDSRGGETFSGFNLQDKNIHDLKRIAEEALLSDDFFLEEDTLTIGPCTPYPPKIICIGLNYQKHALESGMDIPRTPVVFTKFNNTLVDHGKSISLGAAGIQFDYEVELGVVIGKKCKNVPRSHALDHVLGYCVANDLSCRDLQFRSSQWLLGKSLDHFLPTGKYLITSDEIPDVQQLNLGCTLNGELRQYSNTSDMIFTVAEIIEYLSVHMTLEPGDFILTGTPEGVIMGMPEKVWLKPGDVVNSKIEKLGFTENTLI